MRSESLPRLRSVLQWMSLSASLLAGLMFLTSSVARAQVANQINAPFFAALESYQHGNSALAKQTLQATLAARRQALSALMLTTFPCPQGVRCFNNQGRPTDQSSYSASQTVTLTVTVLSGSLPDAGASVSVTITPPKGGVTSLTGTTSSNGVATVSYSLKRKATSGTYQVQANVNGSLASTTFVVQ